MELHFFPGQNLLALKKEMYFSLVMRRGVGRRH